MDSQPSLARATPPEGGAGAARPGSGRRRPRVELARNVLNPQPLPRWIAGGGGAEAGFAAGAAVFALDQILRADPPWLGCWRMRLALRAAVAAARLLRLDADEAGLRDALHLTRPGDDPGPAGRIHDLLRRWASRPLRLAMETEAELAAETGGGQGASELAALLAADRALAERLGWGQPLPLHLAVIHRADLRSGLDCRRPRADGAEWETARHAALLKGAVAAHAEAATLARKAETLATAAASLRTRDEGRGLALVLADESVAPWRMAGRDGLGSDRAARRFCESLHARGALRLLTDRPTFRLYGL